MCMFNANAFDSKIIDTEGKRDQAPVMLSETWSDSALLVAFGGQAFFEQLLCNDSCLWEIINTFLDQDKDVSIGGSQLVEIVEGDDVVWYV